MREWMKVPPRFPGAVRSFVSALSDDHQAGGESFQALFEASPLPLLVTTADTGEVVAANAVAEELSGFPLDALLGRSVFDFGHYKDAADRTAQLAGVEQSPANGREVRIRNAAGQDLHLLAHTSRIILDGRDCFLTAFTNVTALGRLDDGLLAAQRMEVIGKLSGGVAHEFNNLLTVMQGHLDAMTEDEALAPGVRTRVEALHRAVAQATRITSGLLTFSGRNPTTSAVIDLNATLDGLRSLIAGTLGETVEVGWHLGASPASANIAHSHVAQVVLNLALNAREAMPDGGRLVIGTAFVADAEADGIVGGPWIRLFVDDTGHGMSDDVRRHVFEPFFTTKGPGRGTGLGLSICRGIAEQAGGHIAVSSVPGAGTSVRLYLPFAQAPERTAEPAVRPPAHRGSKVVLLVEDEADVRQIVAEILRRAGHVVHQADGLAGADALLDGLPALDLLLTDLVLPGGNGLEVARRVRLRYPGVPVLFMSGYSENVFAGGQAVEHLLQKPFTSRVLLDKLDVLFQD